MNVSELIDRFDWMLVPLLVAAAVALLWLALKVLRWFVLAPWVMREQMMRAARHKVDRQEARAKR
jgi:hypothetical protein